MATVQILIITVACCLFVGRLFFGFFKRLSPFHKHSGSSCQIPHDLNATQTSANQLDTTEAYNKLESAVDEQGDDEPDEEADVHTEQPTSATATPKKKRRNIFKRKNKRYEIFQSPFIPSILRHVSSDYMNIGESKPKSNSFKAKSSQDQQAETETVDLATLVASHKDNREPARCESAIGGSQIELILNSSLDSNALNQSASPADITSDEVAASTSRRAKRQAEKTIGLRNVAFQRETGQDGFEKI
jgi:hypothetical protein